MSDDLSGIIGDIEPPTSSGPPWPRDWRIWWDPKAPHDKGTPAVPPTIDTVPPGPSIIPPPITGTGSPGCQIEIGLEPGGYVGSIIVGDDGSWEWTWPATPLPPGDYCVKARQRCAPPNDEWSEWTDPQCFTIGEIVVPPQTIDFEAKDLRFNVGGNWDTRGTLAFNINGTWTYGVLRKVI